ncbi:spore coat protein [Oceanobacillus timonensis]|uniref:spore coat protein n=1 Tax=Oceanobacillus timonensis TaxID=1926285 RepID=UPI0009B95008|nr:spore coat protein [Oceanobacillus timonensis]
MMQKKEWRALDYCDDNQNNQADVDEAAKQQSLTKQSSEEWIIIKDSEGVTVTTTDTQAAINLQVGIEVAIAVVLSITLADSDKAKAVFQDLDQVMKTKQSNRQKTIVEKSKDVNITTTDIDVAINVQLLIQLLVAIVVSLDIL